MRITFKVSVFLLFAPRGACLVNGGPQGACHLGMNTCPSLGPGGRTQPSCLSASACSDSPTTQRRPCFVLPFSKARAPQSLSSLAAGYKGETVSGNQTYLFYSRGMRSRLSRETPRSPREQSSSRMQGLCFEERNTGYIFNSTINSLLATIRLLQRVLKYKIIVF